MYYKTHLKDTLGDVFPSATYLQKFFIIGLITVI
jgi:hypothetical protein